MQQASYEELQQELDLFFNYNPPPLVPDSESLSLCPKLGPPPSFYEKHLDDRLTLKRIVLMPSITTRLSETVDKTLYSIERQKIRLPSYGPLDHFPTQRYLGSNRFEDPIIDANSVARAYHWSTAIHCMTISSMLFLSPRASQWNMALNWNQSWARGLEGYRALEEDHALRILYMPGTSIPELSISSIIWDSMDNEIRERLPQVAHRFPFLAVWQIFAISEETEHFINDMGRVASLGNFCYDKCLTTWHRAAPTGSLPYAPDAMSTSWGVPVVTLFETPRTSAPSIPPPKVEGTAPSRTRSLRRAQLKVNLDSTTSELKNATDKRRIKTSRKIIGHTTNDETWLNVTVAGRSNSTVTCLTTSLLQHVNYDHLCLSWATY
jgi:hypothetical protein